MRIEQITFTRFLAALSIVIFHFGEKIAPFSNHNISFLFKQANVGVSYFFILSGFVMIIAYGNKDQIDPLEYFKNRFARIYPVYLLAIVLLLIYLIYNSLTIDYSGLYLNIFAMQSWVPGKALSFNRPGWSLSVEWLFYFSFPFLFNYLYKKFDFKKLIFPIILFWVISQLLLHTGAKTDFYKGFPSKSHDLLFYFPLMHLSEFLIGNLAGLYFINNWKDKKINTDIYIVLAVLLFGLWLKFNHYFILHNGLLAIIFIPLIILIAINSGSITKMFNYKFCVFLGEISYGIYILQIPVYRWSEDLFDCMKIKNESAIFYLYLIILLLFSCVSFLFIEKPIRVFIKKWKSMSLD